MECPRQTPTTYPPLCPYVIGKWSPITLNVLKKSLYNTTWPHLFLKYSSTFWQVCTLLRAQNTTLLSKVRRRFFQILWPSHNIWTLIQWFYCFTKSEQCNGDEVKEPFIMSFENFFPYFSNFQLVSVRM